MGTDRHGLEAGEEDAPDRREKGLVEQIYQALWFGVRWQRFARG